MRVKEWNKKHWGSVRRKLIKSVRGKQRGGEKKLHQYWFTFFYLYVKVNRYISVPQMRVLVITLYHAR